MLPACPLLSSQSILLLFTICMSDLLLPLPDRLICSSKEAKAIEVAISSSAAAEFDLIAAAEHSTVLNLFSKRSRQAPNLLLYDYKQLTAASTESKPANRLDWVAVVGFRSIIATVGESES